MTPEIHAGPETKNYKNGKSSMHRCLRGIAAPLLFAATNQALSVEPLAVARAIEGMRIAGDTGEHLNRKWLRENEMRDR